MHKHTNARKNVDLQVFNGRKQSKKYDDKAVPECQEECVTPKKQRIPNQIKNQGNNEIHASLVNADLLTADTAGQHGPQAKSHKSIPEGPRNTHKKRGRRYSPKSEHSQGQIRRTAQKTGKQSKEKNTKNASQNNFSVQMARAKNSFYFPPKTYFTQKNHLTQNV